MLYAVEAEVGLEWLSHAEKIGAKNMVSSLEKLFLCETGVFKCATDVGFCPWRHMAVMSKS